MSTAGVSVLCIDDEEGIRDSLGELLADEGYDVTLASSAEQGLSLLKEKTFHLVITDYALPGQSGGWLLQTARDAGLLREARAVVITAHPNPRGTDGFQVFRKPLDVDDFLRQIHDLLAGARSTEISRMKDDIAQKNTPAKTRGAQIELVLYISSASPASLRAVRNLQRILERYDANEIRFKVHDLSVDQPPEVDADRIAFTPTLVRRAPGTRMWVLGDLQNESVVTDMLAQAGFDPLR